jgi:hypothetical protein
MMADLEKKPIPGSYWVLPGHFLAGEYPGLRYNEARTIQRLDAFLEAGFDTFIDLTNGEERPLYTPALMQEAGYYGMQVSHANFSFPDFRAPSRAAMTAALDAIDTALAGGRKVYLHCVGGIGRTGTVVACWLIRHGMQPDQALERLGTLYAASAQSALIQRSPEADDQIAFILSWIEPRDGLA